MGIFLVKRALKFVPPLFLLAGFFISCTQFFSTSLAPWAARDPDSLIPPVTAGNVEELIDKSANNPDLSLALLKKIRAAAAGASGSDKRKLQSAALEASVNAAGMGQSVLSAAGKITSLDGVDAEAQGKKMVLDAINSMPNLESAGDVLSEILPDDPSTDAFKEFTAASSADDLALAAVMLLSGEAKRNAGDFDGYVSNLPDRKGDAKLTDREKLAMNLAQAAKDRSNEMSGPLKDILSGLKLVS